jgi:restriction system protein
MNNMPEWSLEHLLKTDPNDFENLIAYLFRQMGYEADVTQQSRDGGIDIELRLEHFGLSHRWLLQAKRYAEAVGVREVLEYSSLRYRDDVDGVIIVTTAGFTREAQEEATKHNVKLIGGALLVEMLNHYCPDMQVQEETGIAHQSALSNAKVDGAVLKNGEKIIATEPALIGQRRVMMVITNKNIFFKNETGGILTRKSEIFRRISVNDIIGVHEESKNFFIITGPKEMDILRVQPQKRDKVLGILRSLKADYMRGEYLLRSGRNGAGFLILTNKRLFMTDLRDRAEKELVIKNIIGSEIVRPVLFKIPKIVVLESADGIRKHEIEVDDAQAWQKAIEDAVRVV